MRGILVTAKATTLALALLAATTRGYAAPATPSHHPITTSIENARAVWRQANQPTDPNIANWEAFFSQLQNDLKLATTAASTNDRAGAFARLQAHDAGLAVIAWAPALELRNSLNAWLTPRLQLLEAEKQLQAILAGVSPQTDPTGAGYRDGWLKFVDNDLGAALREYEKATTIAARSQSLDRLRASIAALNSSNVAHPWAPTLALQGAISRLYDQPNLDISADVYSLAPFLANNLITTGPVTRKGYTSQVTAGPHLGYGLMASDDGIIFYNKQAMTTYTPIHDFQNQISSDQKGKRAAKMYEFTAASFDGPQLTIIGIIRPTGLSLFPQYTHAIGATIGSFKQPGGGLARGIASLVGFNQQRITQEVYNGAIGKISSGIVQESMEESTQRTAYEAAMRTQQLSNILVGNNTVAINPQISITQLSLRSRPENALVNGKLVWSQNSRPLGADAPQPAKLLVPDAGVSADLHLGSILNEVAQSYFRNPAVLFVNNLLIESKKPDPANPSAPKANVTPNANFELFQTAINQAKLASDPAVTAIRIAKPSKPPEFATDADGNLVVLITNLQVDIPAPGDKIYRVKSPLAEVVLNFTLEPVAGYSDVKAAVKLIDLNFGARASVSQIIADEGDGQAVPLSGIFLNLARGALKNRQFDLPLDASRLKGFHLTKVYPLDPSGWIRVVLAPGALTPRPNIMIPEIPAAGPIAGNSTVPNPTPTPVEPATR